MFRVLRTFYQALSRISRSPSQKRSRALGPQVGQALEPHPSITWQPQKAHDQGKTPWVDPACAACPGFLVVRAAPALASTFVSEPQIVPLG